MDCSLRYSQPKPKEVKMPLDRSHLEEADRKLLDYIVKKYKRRSGGNEEAHALFDAIQAAFTGTSIPWSSTVVDVDLVSHLAACTWVALGYNKGENIPWDKLDHDCIILHVLRGFSRTLVNAIKADMIRRSKWGFKDGKADPTINEPLFGCFAIPEWFFEWAKTCEWYKETVELKGWC